MVNNISNSMFKPCVLLNANSNYKCAELYPIFFPPEVLTQLLAVTPCRELTWMEPWILKNSSKRKGDTYAAKI